MLNFFDYLYYRTCEFYSKYGEKDPTYTASLIVAILHGLNILAIIFFIELIAVIKIDIKNGYWIAFMLVLIIINYIRYKKYNYGILKQKWDSEGKKVREVKKKIAVLYIALSIIIPISLAIYLSKKR